MEAWHDVEFDKVPANKVIKMRDALGFEIRRLTNADNGNLVVSFEPSLVCDMVTRTTIRSLGTSW